MTIRSTVLILAACAACLFGCSQPPGNASDSRADAGTGGSGSDGGVGQDAGCSDDCALDTTQCSGEVIENCMMLANGCLGWSEGIDCADTFEVCAEDSSGSAVCGADCSSETTCLMDGDQQCSGSLIQNCFPDDNGCLVWTETEDCGAYHDCDDSGQYPTCVCAVVTELAVSTNGTGGATGTVSTNDAAIDCGTDCSESYTCDLVLVSATPDLGSRFEGWSGDCEFDCPCELSMVEDHAVSANFAPAGLNWARSFLGGDYYPEGIVSLPNGDIVVAGWFSEFIILGNELIVSDDNTDIYIARFTSTGEHVWHRTLLGAGYNKVLAVAADSEGNIVIGGEFSGDLDFGAGLVTANMQDAFVAKFAAADGALVWTEALTGPGGAYLNGLAVDGANDVVVTGKFGVSVEIGGTVHTTANANGFVARLAGATGSRVWSRDFGDVGIKFGNAISTTAAGDLLVAGTVLGDLDLGCGLLPAPASSLPVTGSSLDIFAAKFDGATGACVWSTRWEGVSYDVVEAIATTPDDGFVIAGSFQETLQFGSAPLTSVASADGFVASFSSEGVHRWSLQISGDLQQVAHSVAVDSLGNVLVGGEYKLQADFGGISKCSIDDRFNAFVAKYDANGSPQWVKDYGDDWSYGFGIAADATDNVLLVGQFTESVDFGGGPLVATNGGRNMFVVSLEP